MWRIHPFEVGPKAAEVGVAAYERDGMIGAATAEVDFDAKAGTVQSLFVTPEHRGRGVARQLLHALERRVCANGATRLDALYRALDPTAVAMTHILSKSGWRVPNASTLIVAGSVPPADLPWMQVRKRDGYEIYGWTDLGERELFKIAPSAAVGGRPSEVSRWSSDFPVEPLCSVAVRYHGELVGWMLTHRLDRERVRYSRLFVRPEHQAHFSGLALVSEAFRRQRAACIPKCLCAISSDNRPMVHLIMLLAPFMDSKTEICLASKGLG